LAILEALLRDVNRGLFEMARRIKQQTGLPPLSIRVIGSILSVPGTTVSEIARETGMAKSHVSHLVARLSEEGFVEKRPDPEDQRLVRIYPTPAAREPLMQMRRAMREQLSAALGSIPSDQGAAVVEGLRVLKEALDRCNRGADVK
jgi:DNA-binding MarR family transcriptional regulator